jgi:hypothetical protein
MDQLTLGGVVVHKFPTPPNVRVRALGLVARVLAILALVATALLIAWGWPTRTRRAGDIVRSQPIKSWGNGALVMLSPLLLGGLAALVAGLTPASASLPLLVIFVPLVLISAGIVLVLSLVAGIPAALALGEALPGEFGKFGSLLLGAAVVGLLWLVPIVGWLVVVLALPLGLGAWMLSFRAAQAPAEG